MRERIPARGHPKLADSNDRRTNSEGTNTHSAEPLEDPAVDSLSLKPQASSLKPSTVSRSEITIIAAACQCYCFAPIAGVASAYLLEITV